MILNSFWILQKSKSVQKGGGFIEVLCSPHRLADFSTLDIPSHKIVSLRVSKSHMYFTRVYVCI